VQGNAHTIATAIGVPTVLAGPFDTHRVRWWAPARAEEYFGHVAHTCILEDDLSYRVWTPQKLAKQLVAYGVIVFDDELGQYCPIV
jgi:hypothetical protein